MYRTATREVEKEITEEVQTASGIETVTSTVLVQEKYQEEYGALYKNTKNMELSPIVTVTLATGEEVDYQLRSVAIHRPGHYHSAVSYVDVHDEEAGPTTHWVDHNDSSSSYIGAGATPRASWASVESSAYVLIYERVG